MFLLSLTGCLMTIGSGVSVTETRSVEGFDRIDGVAASNLVQLQITVDPEAPPALALRCDDNLLPFIVTERDGDTLVVRSIRGRSLSSNLDCVADVTVPALVAASASGSGGVTVTTPAPDLAQAHASGSGAVEAFGLSVESLRATASGSGGLWLTDLDVGMVAGSASGSGGLVLSGDAVEIDFSTSGSGGIAAIDLVAGDAVLVASGSGDIEATVLGSAQATTSGSGSIHLWGDPAEVTSNSTGSGRVVVH